MTEIAKCMFFGKGPKGGGGVFFNPKIYIADFGPLNEALEFFSKMRGGSKAVWNFSENSSVLVP